MNLKMIVAGIVMLSAVLGAFVFVVEDSDVPEHTEAAVQSYQLHNGLKVLVLENHRAPVVVSQIWYKVGGSYEHDGITGLSHVLEHMMFKGTKKHPAGEFSEIIAANGGRENAFTSMDYTAYFQRIAKDRLELCLELEADRMHNLLLDEKEFAREIEVIKEERRLRTDDKPTALTYERFNAVAYTNNPYRHPVIGWMEDLDNLTIKDVREWYNTWYAPNNATLVIAGDVDAGDVFQMVKKHFASIPMSTIPRLKPRTEAQQYGIQRVSVQVPAKIPYLIMGYKVPSLMTVDDEADAYALEVLAGILDGGNSARLSDRLVRGKQIATSASAGYSLSARHETMLTLSAIPADGVSLLDIETALRREVSLLQETPVSDDELERIKAQVVAANVYQQDSIFYQAMEVGIMETVGLQWQKKDEYVAKVQAVTAEQIQQVARRYLQDSRLTVAVLKPESTALADGIGKQVTASGGELLR